MTDRVKIYEDKMPLLVFMFSMWSINNEYSGRRAKTERIKKIDAILQDPISAYYYDLDVIRLCDEYQQYHHLMCTKDAKGLDCFITKKKKKRYFRYLF